MIISNIYMGKNNKKCSKPPTRTIPNWSGLNSNNSQLMELKFPKVHQALQPQVAQAVIERKHPNPRKLRRPGGGPPFLPGSQWSILQLQTEATSWARQHPTSIIPFPKKSRGLLRSRAEDEFLKVIQNEFGLGKRAQCFAHVFFVPGPRLRKQATRWMLFQKAEWNVVNSGVWKIYVNKKNK